MSKESKEAQSLFEKGKKQIQKGLFRGPNYEDASTTFNSAAQIFLKLFDYANAKEAFENSAICYDKLSVTGKSAQQFVEAAKAALEINDFKEVVRLLQEAKIRFLEKNQGTSASRIIRDMAQKIKPQDPNVAFELLDISLEIMETDNSYHWGKDSFVEYALLSYELNQDLQSICKAWDRAKKAFIYLKNYDNAAHCAVSAIAIVLKAGDVVQAQRLFNENMQEDWFIHTEDFNMIDMVIRGVNNRDGDVLEQGQHNFIVGFLKPEIAKIIYSFKAPKKEETAPVHTEPSEEPISGFVANSAAVLEAQREAIHATEAAHEAAAQKDEISNEVEESVKNTTEGTNANEEEDWML